MKREILNQDNFDSLLKWLDPNREKAGEKYETIRNGLINMFEYKGCISAEELADETIDRVAKRVEEIAGSYTGDPARYFYGVARRVYLEYLKRRQTVELPAILKAPQADDTEQQYECLDQCMQSLTDSNRSLILQYYSERKQAKIDSRRSIRQMLNLKPSALRVRVFRIRATLEKCVLECLELRE